MAFDRFHHSSKALSPALYTQVPAVQYPHWRCRLNGADKDPPKGPNGELLKYKPSNFCRWRCVGLSELVKINIIVVVYFKALVGWVKGDQQACHDLMDSNQDGLEPVIFGIAKPVLERRHDSFPCVG